MIFVLVGLVALVMCFVISALVALPVAAGLSYAPYLFYALLRWRPRLRGVRQMVVFGAIWLVFTMLSTCVLVLGTNFQAVGLNGESLTSWGVELFQPIYVWFVPLVVAAFLGVGGEVSLHVLRRWVGPSPEEVLAPGAS